VAAPSEPERALLSAALRGDAEACARLLRAVADLIWTACRLVTREEAETEAVFRDVVAGLRANGFSRLKGYDGRAPVNVYVALVVRDLLAERAIRLLAIDGERGWRAFEGFFGEDARHMIARLLPGPRHQHDREDAYQAVCEALLNNDHARLRAYSGRGSPSGFVLHTMENLVIDFVRTIVPRRRLPAGIQRLAALDQTVFRLIYWDRIDPVPSSLCRHLSRTGEAPPSETTVGEAITRVNAALPSGYHGEARGEGRTLSLSAAEDVILAGGAEDFAVRTPEDDLVDGQSADLLERALDVLQRALPKLAAAERLYLQMALTGQPAREIARLTGCPVEDIHKLAQRVKRRLRDELGDDAAVKKWKLSV
jgi:RNA polymerase primary sigma factor